MVECLEHKKLSLIMGKDQLIKDFITWLEGEEKLVIARLNEHGELIPIHKPIEIIIAKYFGIDLDTLEKEKIAMIDEFNWYSQNQPADRE